MDDLRQARQHLRDLLVPFRRIVDSYMIKETLGHSTFPGGRLSDMKPEHWRDDEVLVEARVKVKAAENYPIGAYEDTEYETLFHVEVVGSREKAIAAILAQVEAKTPHWKKRIDEDDVFAAYVGRSLKMRKLHVHMARGADNKVVMRKIEAGTVGQVVRHSPGYLIVDFGEPVKKVALSTWMFLSGYSHYEDPVTGENLKTVWRKGAKEVFVADPYWEWVEE